MDENTDLQYARINDILGKSREKDDWDLWKNCYYEYLKKALEFPIEVTGIEDFNWEEFYFLGPGSSSEYKKLKKTQPSFKDIFILNDISTDDWSEWMLCENEDISALVVRKKDKKEFVLGLSELQCTSENDKMYQLLDDYSVFFCNYR